jgi:hypothetical protein
VGAVVVEEDPGREISQIDCVTEELRALKQFTAVTAIGRAHKPRSFAIQIRENREASRGSLEN